MTRVSLLWIIAVSLLAGCMGAPDVGRTTGELSSADMIPAISQAEWMAASVGCEDALGPDLTFHEAVGAPELVVCTAPDGRIVCVDSAAAIEEELSSMGEELLLGIAGHQGTGMDDEFTEKPFYPGSSRAISSPTEGDPSPQPNNEGSDEAGDPSPQPNAVSGDPSPQPNAASGDPSPQPNAASGDPSPQPNHEAASGGDAERSSGDPSPQPNSEDGATATNAEMDSGDETTELSSDDDA